MNFDIETIDQMNPIEIFQGNNLDDILASISDKVSSEVPDISTTKGRDRIKSLAHQVARTKTNLDNLGKSLVADWKSKSKAVDQSRKTARDFLDALKIKVRGPLTEWELAETGRIESIERRIETIRSLTVAMDDADNWIPSAVLKPNLEKLKSIVIDESFDEFSAAATLEKDFAITKLEEAITSQEAREVERAELDRLRIEFAEREQKERDDRIAKEAAETAAREERERANEEIRAAKEKEEAAEREKLEAEQRLKDQEAATERQRTKAAEKAEREKQNAIEEERCRVLRDSEREAAERSRREADITHRKSIDNDAVEGFTKGGLSKEDSQLAVELITKRLIAHVNIIY